MSNADYDFSVIRFLRKEKRLSLRALAQQSGVSLGAVAKIESNRGNPVLRTLAQLGKVLGISVSDLLALAERRKPRRDRARRQQIGGTEFTAYDADERKFLFAQLPKGWRASAPAIHGNVSETCVVLSGRVEIMVHDAVFKLGPRDVLQFDAVFDHEYHAVAESSVLIIHEPRGSGRRS
ncbi:MAG: XRE family transcriptional regulator [Planctomycetota bacterium]